MNMIEKVTEAIRDNIAAALPYGVSVDYRYAAIAAIEAMRGPTPSSLAAGRYAIEPYVGNGLSKEVYDQWQIARETYAAMIDAALEGGDANEHRV